jgi:hypothetical protein
MLKKCFTLIICLIALNNAYATPEIHDVFRVAINSDNLSLKFAASVVVGSYLDQGKPVNPYVALSREFNRALVANVSIKQWAADKQITRSALSALAKYSIPALISRRVNLSADNAEYLSSISSRPEIAIPYASGIKSEALSELVDSYSIEDPYSTGALTAIRYGLLFGLKTSQDQMSKFARKVVTAEDECNSLINTSLIAAKSGNLETMLRNYNAIYLSDLKWQAFLDLTRLAVISDSHDIKRLLIANAPEGGLVSIEGTSNFIEIAAWLLASNGISTPEEITL